MILEQNDFCTKEVRFHKAEIEVTLQTIFPMDLCSLFFLIQACDPQWHGSYRALLILL